jgi:hypothetical protein
VGVCVEEQLPATLVVTVEGVAVGEKVPGQQPEQMRSAVVDAATLK